MGGWAIPEGRQSVSSSGAGVPARHQTRVTDVSAAGQGRPPHWIRPALGRVNEINQIWELKYHGEEARGARTRALARNLDLLPKGAASDAESVRG